jgi:hypothetical protein
VYFLQIALASASEVEHFSLLLADPALLKKAGSSDVRHRRR